MKCPFCDREMKNEGGFYESCDCPQYGYKAPQLGRPNPGYIAFQKAMHGDIKVEVPKARVHKNKYPGSWDADWTPAGARWWDYVLGGVLAVVVYPIALVSRVFRRKP